jgi:hypothetical protein
VIDPLHESRRRDQAGQLSLERGASRGFAAPPAGAPNHDQSASARPPFSSIQTFCAAPMNRRDHSLPMIEGVPIP